MGFHLLSPLALVKRCLSLSPNTTARATRHQTRRVEEVPDSELLWRFTGGALGWLQRQPEGDLLAGKGSLPEVGGELRELGEGKNPAELRHRQGFTRGFLWG